MVFSPLGTSRLSTYYMAPQPSWGWSLGALAGTFWRFIHQPCQKWQQALSPSLNKPTSRVCCHKFAVIFFSQFWGWVNICTLTHGSLGLCNTVQHLSRQGLAIEYAFLLGLSFASETVLGLLVDVCVCLSLSFQV